MNDIIFGATNDSVWGFFQAYAGKVWDEYDGRIEVLPWTSDQENRWRHIHTSNQVREGTFEEVQDGRCKPNKDPIHPTSILGLDEESKQVDEKTYRGMMRSLSYLIASRPDIMFSVYLCARF